MPSNRKPLSPEDLAAHEASQDFASDLIQSIREMKAGLGTVVYSPVAEARKKTGLSQEEFAALLDVPVATLHLWETTPAQPNETAKELILMAIQSPQAFLAKARSGK
jgi:putative transcriptional regulator